MLATSENGLFPGHNHLLTTGTYDSTLGVDNQGVGSSPPVVGVVLHKWTYSPRVAVISNMAELGYCTLPLI